jgi:hypothetical protein
MASEIITPPAESSLTTAIRSDSGTSRCEGFENLVGQWKETSALLNKRDVIIGVRTLLQAWPLFRFPKGRQKTCSGGVF